MSDIIARGLCSVIKADNIKLKNKEAQICRIDITDKIQNGDFNPSDEHIINYLKANEEPEQNNLKHPKNKNLQKLPLKK